MIILKQFLVKSFATAHLSLWKHIKIDGRKIYYNAGLSKPFHSFLGNGLFINNKEVGKLCQVKGKFKITRKCVFPVDSRKHFLLMSWCCWTLSDLLMTTLWRKPHIIHTNHTSLSTVAKNCRVLPIDLLTLATLE